MEDPSPKPTEKLDPDPKKIIPDQQNSSKDALCLWFFIRDF